MKTRLYRILQLLLLCTLIFGGIYVWRWITDPIEFPVKTVKIQASYEHTNRQTLQQAILPSLDEGFINLNTSLLKEELLQFPWVADAEIKRLWPSTLLIKITEHQAIASLGKHGLLDTKGQIFTPPENTFPNNLPLLDGPIDKTAVMLKDYEMMTDILKPLKFRIQKLTIDTRLSLQLELIDDTGKHLRLVLGKTDPLPQLQRFVKVHHKIFTSSDAKAEYVDLRYNNGMSVKWHTNQ